MQNEQQQQVIKALKEANNVLVTVKNSPSVDELSAAVGLTLALNKADKHATTVFSGSVPSTIEFLQPEQVIESNTDSLRDFIIALDKSKADKLRYKVEDSVVRIFITPYRASITDKDLEFSQGDFNVDVVIALGVVTKDDFDTAVTAHGRILHDATVIGITKRDAVSQVGSLNWQEPNASSVSEMISKVVDGVDPQLVDGQMATAFLTGIVAETDRFKNDKTTPDVLAISSRLMTAGANQQLIAEKLEEPVNEKPITKIANHDADHDDGALEIEHDDEEVTGIQIDEHGNLDSVPAEDEELPSQPEQEVEEPQEEPIIESPVVEEEASRQYIATPMSPNNAATQPNTVKPANEVSQPTMVAPDMPAPSPDAVVNAQQEPANASVPTPQPGEEPSTPVDAIPGPAPEAQSPVMDHKQKTLQPVSDEFKGHVTTDQPAAPNSLAALEEQIGSPHIEQPSVDSVREQVAGLAEPQMVPQQNIGAQHVDLQPPEEVAPVSDAKPAPLTSSTQEQEKADPNGPPAVPPPLMPPSSSQPQFFDADGKNNNPFASK